MYNIGFIFDQDRVREKSAIYYIDHKAINKIVKEQDKIYGLMKE